MDEATVRLMARWQAGDQQAAGEMFRRYALRLIELARSRLSSALARRVDPEDVVQSAYRSFFAGARAGRFELRSGGDLWKLLVVITLNKLRNQAKRHAADKRAVGREQGLGDGLDAAALADEPSPVQAVALVDEVEQLMRRLDAGQRAVLELRLQGFTLYEIAAQTRRSVPTVRRALDRVKEELARRQQDGGPL